MNKDNPHEIIELIGKPKQWREKASIILIKLWENDERNKQRQAAILGLLTAELSLLGALLVKLLFL